MSPWFRKKLQVPTRVKIFVSPGGAEDPRISGAHQKKTCQNEDHHAGRIWAAEKPFMVAD